MADRKSPSLEEEKREEAIETISSESVTDYGGDTSLPPPPKLTPEQEKKLYRKVDLWLMPILTLMYLFSFLDRGKRTDHLSCRVDRSFLRREYRKRQITGIDDTVAPRWEQIQHCTSTSPRSNRRCTTYLRSQTMYFIVRDI